MKINLANISGRERGEGGGRKRKTKGVKTQTLLLR